MRHSESGNGAAPVLTAFAGRVRRLREARGWTRADLARRSGLSVRFLARIEAGDGNVSLRRLASLAGALETTSDELLRPETSRTGIIALVGLRGAGKSTVGPILARRLRVGFVEMDSLVQEACNLSLDQIFELHGEAYYRRLEREILARVLARDGRSVVAAAGGVVTEPASWELLLRRTTVVWLRADPEDHWRRVVAQGDRRPMADNPDAMAQLRALLAAREKIYSQAHVIVDTAGRSPRKVAAAVEEELAGLAGAESARKGRSHGRVT